MLAKRSVRRSYHQTIYSLIPALAELVDRGAVIIASFTPTDVDPISG